MAFVSSFTPTVNSALPTSFTSTALCHQTAPQTGDATIPHRSVTMKVDLKEKIKADNATFKYLEEARLAKEQSLYTPQRGFTDAAETLNGRMAMMGFVLGLTTELITGKGINAQMAALFGPLLNLHF